MENNRVCMYYIVAATVSILMIAAFFVGMPSSSSSRSCNNNSNHLECFSRIIEVVDNDQYERSLRDFIYFSAQYALRENTRYEYRSSIMHLKQHFTSSTTLKERVNLYAKCKARKTIAHKFAVCSIQNKNSHLVQEWLSHYLLLGTSKVYIYDNNLESNQAEEFKKVLLPFEEIGFVQRVSWTNVQYGQIDSYRQCTEKAIIDGMDYVGFIDGDEFLYLDPKYECIDDFLEKLEQNSTFPVGDVAMWPRNMMTYGAPIYNNSKTLVEQMKYFHITDLHKKHIVKLKAYVDIPNPHIIFLKEGYYEYSLKGEVLPASLNFPNFTDFRIEDLEFGELRHYYGQTLDYLLFEKICGDGFERTYYMDIRIERSFREYRIDEKRMAAPVPNNEAILRKFMFG